MELTLSQEVDDQRLNVFLHEAIFWVRINFAIASSTPLQIYSSGILRPSLMHEESNLLSSETPDWISSAPKLPVSWRYPGLETVELRCQIRTMVTSKDSQLIGTIQESPIADERHLDICNIWSTNTGGRLHKFMLHRDEHYYPALAFADDSSMFATAASDGSVTVWDTDTEVCKHVFNVHGSESPGTQNTRYKFQGLCFSPSSEAVAALYLVSSDSSTSGLRRVDAMIALFNITTEERKLMQVGIDHGQKQMCLSWSTQFHGLVFTADGTSIKIWSEIDESQMQKIEPPREEALDTPTTPILVTEVSILTGLQISGFQLSFPFWESIRRYGRGPPKPPIVFSKDMELVAFQSKSEDHQFVVMEVETSKIRLSLPVSAISAAFSMDGSVLAIYSTRRHSLWSTSTGSEVASLELSGLNNFHVEDADFVLLGTPTIGNRTVLVPFSANRGFYFWRFCLDQSRVRTTTSPTLENASSTQLQPGCFLGGSILGQLLVVITGRTDGTVWLNQFRPDHLVQRKMLKGGYPPYPWAKMTTTFSPNGRYVAGQWGTGAFTVWCVADGKCVLEISADRTMLYAFSWGSDGIAVVPWNARQPVIHVYRLETSEIASTIDLLQYQATGKARIHALLFSRDDQELIIRTHDDQVVDNVRLIVWQFHESHFRLLHSHQGVKEVTGWALLPNPKFLAVSVHYKALSTDARLITRRPPTGNVWLIDISTSRLLHNIESTMHQEDFLSERHFERISHQGFLSRFSEFPLLAMNEEDELAESLYPKPPLQILRALEHRSGTKTWIDFFGQPFFHLATDQKDLVQPQIFLRFVGGSYIVLAVGGDVMVITLCLEKLWKLALQSGMRVEINHLNGIPRLICPDT